LEVSYRVFNCKKIRPFVELRADFHDLLVVPNEQLLISAFLKFPNELLLLRKRAKIRRSYLLCLKLPSETLLGKNWASGFDVAATYVRKMEFNKKFQAMIINST